MKNIVAMALLFWLPLPIFGDPGQDARCREIAFSRSVEDRDLELFKTFLDSDARFVGNAVLTGPEEIAAAWNIFFLDDGPAIKWRPRFVEVLEDETLALTRGPYRMIETGADGKSVESWGTFNSVWRKLPNGKWRVIFDAGSLAADPPDEQTQALLEKEDDC